jgi:succinate dehydrogenase/fumarate reductase flavoprotein subunit
MDMRHCDKEEVHHLQYVLMPGDKATFLDYADQAGIDFAKFPMEVEFSEIELSGMLKTDDHFETTVSGLYNGCVFYNFSGSLCSGHIAGTHAAESLAERYLPDAVDAHEIAREKERVLKPLIDPGELKPDYIEGVIRQVMKYYMGFVRNEKGMQAALDKLGFVEGHLSELSAANHHELMKANEAVHLLKICQLAVAATMQRRESGRALYQRSDYPDLDDRYAKILTMWQSEVGPQFEWL